MVVKGSMRGNHLPLIRRRSPQAMASSPRGSPVQTENLMLEASPSYLHSLSHPKPTSRSGMFSWPTGSVLKHTRLCFPALIWHASHSPTFQIFLQCLYVCVCMHVLCVCFKNTNFLLFFSMWRTVQTNHPYFFPSTVWKQNQKFLPTILNYLQRF